MTYYAVTNDPNELAHFGIKGMKWGIRRTDAQLGHPRHHGSGRRRSTGPKSEAYKKAESKLHKMMKSGIKKAEANWKAYNSPAAKEQRFMKKAMQQARNGTLKYGKLTDDQVRRVTNRLALEQDARRLGSTEQPRYGKRIKTAIGEGIVRGIGAGTGAYIEERFRGRGRTTADIKRDKRMAKYESSLAGRTAEKRKAKNEINKEFYKTAYEEGLSPSIYLGAKDRAKYLSEVKERNKKKDYSANIQKIYDEQESRMRAANVTRREDEDARKIRNDTSRQVGKGTALKQLNDYNESRERINRHGNAYMDSYYRALADEERKRIDDRNTSAKRKRKGRR